MARIRTREDWKCGILIYVADVTSCAAALMAAPKAVSNANAAGMLYTPMPGVAAGMSIGRVKVTRGF